MADEEKIRNQLGKMELRSTEDTLNHMPDAEDGQITNVHRPEQIEGGTDLTRRPLSPKTHDQSRENAAVGPLIDIVHCADGIFLALPFEKNLKNSPLFLRVLSYQDKNLTRYCNDLI